MNENTPSNQGAAAKLQAVVDYLPGISIAGAQSALLEWSADDRIKLFIMDFTAEPAKATEVLFDVPVSEVTNVGGSPVMLVFTVKDKKYNAQFSRTAMAKLSVGGLAGLGMASSDMSASGSPAWVAKLKEHNVAMKGYKGLSWSINAAFVVLGIILIVFFLVIFVPTLINTGGNLYG